MPTPNDKQNQNATLIAPSTPSASTAASAEPSSAPAPSTLMTVDINQLAQLIATAASQMNVGVTAGLAEAIAKGIAGSQRRKVTIGEYVATATTSFHPTPGKHLHLRYRAFQNGGECMESTLFDEEIDLLNRITHSGRYINRLVEVDFHDPGGEDPTIRINYNNKRESLDGLRGELPRTRDYKSVFHAMLAVIVAEQEQEDLDAMERSIAKTADAQARRR